MKKTNKKFVQGESSREANGKRKILLSFAFFFLFALLANQLNAQCSMTCKNVNISVDDSCNVDIHWSNLATIPAACNADPADSLFRIVLLDRSGNEIASSDTGTVSANLGDYLMDSIMIEVHYEDSFNYNFCWSNALVESKIAPQIMCRNDTVSCLEGEVGAFPPVLVGGCADSNSVEFIIRNQSFTNICDDNFLKIMTRTYQARDMFGNLSAVCSDTVWFERFEIDSVERPRNYMLDSSLSCDGDWDSVEVDGYPQPSETGVPMYEGLPLYDEEISACNLQFFFEDRTIPTPCGLKIAREWTAMEWCDGDVFTSFGQVIEILDTTPPVVVAPFDTVELSTSTNQCEASLVVPPATVTDNCSEVENYTVYTNAPGVGSQNFDEPTAVNLLLPVGVWTVYIAANDICLTGGQGLDSFVVTIQDNTPPVAVCDRHTSVSLTTDGSARAYVSTFDDGSYDECTSIDSIAVRRMGFDCDNEIDEFGPYVEFCCADVGTPVMVILRVYDESGNWNECMVEVDVQDKQPASIVAPPDITVSCELPIDTSDLSVFGSIVQLNSVSDLFGPNDPRDSILIDDPGDLVTGLTYKGLDGYATDNCQVSIMESFTFNRDNCGKGTIHRVFTAVGAGNNTQAVDEQWITITDFTPFNFNTVDWPNDITITNQCGGAEGLTPEYLRDSVGVEYGFPRYEDEACSQIAVGFEDQLFSVSSPDDPACFKILRTWTIIDWCTYDSDPNQPWEYSQTIKVLNNIAPEFVIPCEDTVLVSSSDDCDSRFVELMQLAEDDCTPQSDLTYRYRIDAFNDGTFDISGFDNDASGDYPIGTHLIQWSVEDDCNNVNTCSYLFTIDNRKAPSPICRPITVELMAIDTDNDGTPDDGMLDIWASDFNHKSFHACGIEITGFSFSSDPLDTNLMLTCDDIGTREVEMWVHAANGTSDFCRTYVIVQANNGACGPGNEGPTFPIAGNISNPVANTLLKDVEIDLQGSSVSSLTDANGHYDFNPMPEGGNYNVVPSSNEGILNGVSTLDILLIQRHILGLGEFESPYQHIAADVNKDNRISGSDIVDIRKVILGINDEFQSNTSWRFIDAEYNFVTNNPLEEPFDENYRIPSLNRGMQQIDFYGVKVGDINGDADNRLRFRNGEGLNFVTDNKALTTGEIYEMQITADNFDDVQGYQLTFDYDESLVSFEGLSNGAISLDDDQYIFNEEKSAVAISYDNIKGLTLSEDEVLFSITFRAKANIDIAEAVELNNEIAVSEAYRALEVVDAELEFRGLDNTESEFALYQNSPNPFADFTTIQVRLPEDMEAKLTVFDVTGKQMFEYSAQFNAGMNQIRIDNKDIQGSGVLYYRLEAGAYTATKRMLVIK